MNDILILFYPLLYISSDSVWFAFLCWTGTAVGNAAFSRMEAQFGGFQKCASAWKQAGHSSRSTSPWHGRSIAGFSDVVCPKKFLCFALFFFFFPLFFDSFYQKCYRKLLHVHYCPVEQYEDYIF